MIPSKTGVGKTIPCFGTSQQREKHFDMATAMLQRMLSGGLGKD
jgi:hypothetical protein